MRPASDLEEFVARPVGRHVSGVGWLCWCSDAALFGQLYWGRPDEGEVRRLVRAWEAELSPQAAPHGSLVDASRLQSVDAGVFAMVAERLAGGRAGFADKVQRQVIVRPAGLAGAVVAGFYSLQPPPYPVEVVSTLSEALAVLGRSEVADEIAELTERTLGVDPLLRALRDQLAARHGNLSLESAARALAVSPRTLQRRLREAATTFQAELNAARVRAAQMLLADSDAKLTAIALDVGCASLQHFSGLFRRSTGEAPSAWRARHRGARDGRR